MLLTKEDIEGTELNDMFQNLSGDEVEGWMEIWPDWPLKEHVYYSPISPRIELDILDHLCSMPPIRNYYAALRKWVREFKSPTWERFINELLSS